MALKEIREFALRTATSTARSEDVKRRIRARAEAVRIYVLRLAAVPLHLERPKDGLTLSHTTLRDSLTADQTIQPGSPPCAPIVIDVFTLGKTATSSIEEYLKRSHVWKGVS
jgi:hypothetical protein